MISLVLLVPILALPTFWIAPVPVALSFYGLVLIGSVMGYYFLLRYSRGRFSTIGQLLRGSYGRVIQVKPYLRVQIDGELWHARSDEPLRVGDHIVVSGVNGFQTHVRKVVTIDHQANPSKRGSLR